MIDPVLFVRSRVRFCTFLPVILLSLPFVALGSTDPVMDTLVENRWRMVRKTGVGLVETIWHFQQDGTGLIRLEVTRDGRTTTYQHRFDFELDGNRITIQEEIEAMWRGYFGVSTWTLNEGKIVGDVTFRDEVLVFSHE
ncbi:MAG: hypothetical protein O2780_15785 [Proteobacteria bacterium]|jgi:hypothetical protein|nr:hypothetical protein [Pseudomonadota bacterium]MDA1298898.1 hypothetical protein [Pseudomonadota bacterium]